MKLTQLRYFLTICKYNNITYASDELHVSQPSLSNAVKELEEEFGVTLFYRLSKGLALTEEGEFLLQEADRLLDLSDGLVSRMCALGKKSQEVRLGVPPMCATLVFPKLFKAFCKSFPAARLKMIEYGSVTNKAKVLDGSLDAAIISSDEPVPCAFHHCDLDALNIRFYTSARSTLAQLPAIDLTGAATVPLALLAEDSFLTNFLYQRYKNLGMVPQVAANTNQLNTIRHLVANNTAAAFLFDNILESDESIIKLPVSDLPKIQIRLIWRANRKLSPATCSLIKLAQAEYQ